MQVDNNYNNFNNRINFGARRIMSAKKVVDGLSEKFEVYKLDYTDIPFAQKLAIYMKNQKHKLNDSQKKLFYKLREFVTHQERFDVPEYFFGPQKDLFIGIKNDEQISGFMQLNNERVRFSDKRRLSIDEISPNTNDKVVEATFFYAFFGDKRYSGDIHSVWATKFNKCKAFMSSCDGAKSHLRRENPDYKFRISTKSDYIDLEDKLGIAE